MSPCGSFGFAGSVSRHETGRRQSGHTTNSPEPAMFDADRLDRLVMHTIFLAFVIACYPW